MALVESQKTIISVNAQDYQASNDNKLIHLSGQAKTDETLFDPAFQVGTQALKLRCIVQTYQWQAQKSSDPKKKLGEGTENTTPYTLRCIRNSTFEPT